MDLLETIKTMSYVDIAYHFSTKNKPLIEAKRLNTWYRNSQMKYSFENEILNVALILAMRVKSDHEIPNNKYLNSILERFKKFNVTTLDDAVTQFKITVEFETKKNNPKLTRFEQQKENSPQWTQDYLKSLESKEDLN